MSLTIPTEVEKDIKSGKARYGTFQTGVGGQSVLPVDPNSYVIIFGYDFSPAGGGIGSQDRIGSGNVFNAVPDRIAVFNTQQISFYTGRAFHPFIHHVDIVQDYEIYQYTLNPGNNQTTVNQYQYFNQVDTTPQTRSTYIIADRSVAITVGLIKRLELNSASAIPVTDKTPPNLTYGGSAATPNVETIFSSNLANPPSFVQPSLKDFNDYGLGGVPGNAQDQAFALPDNVDGLIDPSQWLQDQFNLTYRERAGANYFLNVHYALYTNQSPEQLG
jgi:hypothetical protein